ncbi:MAG TPA: iron-containing alcohol dehydrogenase [Syntrophomonadaceae bacterium]|nr:iron-containing alcohol dehydrogenase [Syntrophomonadaceae bacterium]HNX29797.1 iron-containing alcohol dehydrogenase [Syntrophomonadaceae bacterium]HPR94331.1 iron-containing alcohol dehydrogenase [Syntrophomonadaceae bacterium]
MFNFDFYNPTKIMFGQGRIADIAGEIPRDARVLITYGGGSIKNNGVYDEVKAALAGYDLTEFAGIEPNPLYETLMKAVALVKTNKIDFLLAVGGGSVIDGTKFIAAAARYTGDPWEIILSRGTVVNEVLPLGVVLTLPAAGSESNHRAVVTRKSMNAKISFYSTLFFPRFAVLDPTKTYSLPTAQISNGVVDAYMHVLEQYLTYPVNAKVQERFAEGLLLTLIEEGPKALAEPMNYEVRSNIMLCATMALNGLIGSGVPEDWSTHMVGHELTALYGIDHAATLTVLLPGMLKVLKEDKRPRLLQYAERIWGLKGADKDAVIDAAIEKTREFFVTMQMKTRLSDYGLTADNFPEILSSLKAHNMVKLGERKNVTPDRVRQALEFCL